MVCQYAVCLHQDELKSEKDGFAICDPTSDYVPRNPADSVLYSAVAEHLETFLAKQRQRERIVPRFVERELRKFLECGILAHGFLRVHCDACGRDRVVAYSCYPQQETMKSSPLRMCYFTQSSQGFTPHSFWPLSHAMSLSSTRNAPRRSSGGKAFSIASSFSVGSARR
jgi:hypothetical protein